MSTPKPEGLLSKMKEIVKSSVDNLRHDEKKNNTMFRSGSAAQVHGNLGSGSESGAPAHIAGEVNVDEHERGGGNNGASGSGLMSKIKEGAKEIKEEAKSLFKSDESRNSSLSGERSDASSPTSGEVMIGPAGGSVQVGTAHNSAQVSSTEDKSEEGTTPKLVRKAEDKASEISEKIRNPLKEQSSRGASQLAHSGDAKSLTVQLFDKSHEAVKEPLEKMLRPLDRVLGYEKDPLIRIYDTGHETLRHPIAMVAEPVESMLSGAFKTSDEAKREADRSLSERERLEEKKREERLKEEGRSILGEITDKSFELAEKPIELILKPVDRLLGLDKDGKKNPLIQLLDEVYGISRKPVDAIVRPFENILRKMAEGEQAYQMSVRMSADNDPKLVTRLADGALNIADRIITWPLELALRALLFDQTRKLPIIDATHSLKNATKLGVELFTRPIDRIIKEIADIGAIKDEAERENEMELKRLEASRLVHALDRLHEITQAQWEIILRPVGKLLGYSKEGKKEPLLRAWDIVHQVVRTPIQVVSKPLEDAILGEVKRQQPPSKHQPKAELRQRADNMGERRKNFFTEQIRKVEKIAAKPFDVITSPIRRLILGEEADMDSRSSGTTQAGATKAGGGKPINESDKIVSTISQLNNVVLKPIEVITQPISDLLTTDEKNIRSQAPTESSEAPASAFTSTSTSASAPTPSQGSSSVSISGPTRSSNSGLDLNQNQGQIPAKASMTSVSTPELVSG